MAVRVGKGAVGKLVVVDWIDSCGENGWRNQQTLSSTSPARCQTSGYLAHSDRKHMILCRSRGMDAEILPWEGPLSIPREAVTGVRVIPSRYFERRKR